MKENFISGEEFAVILSDVQQKISRGEIKECADMVNQLLSGSKTAAIEIDRDYITNLKQRKKETKIREISRMLSDH